MASAVLDTSALLAFVHGEPGAELVARVIGDSMVSTVNFAEAVTALVRRGSTLDEARDALEVAEFDLVDFDRAQAEAAGDLITRTRARGLSLGDRACIALAVREGVPAFTADRAWKEIKLPAEVRLIR